MQLPWGAQWVFVLYINTGFNVELLDVLSLENLRKLGTNTAVTSEVKRLVRGTLKAGVGDADGISDMSSTLYASGRYALGV